MIKRLYRTLSIRTKIMLLALLLSWLPLIFISVSGFGGLMQAGTAAIESGPAAVRTRAEEELRRRVQDRARLYDADFVAIERQVETIASYMRVLLRQDAAPPSTERVWIAPDGPSGELEQYYSTGVAQARRAIPILQAAVRQNPLVSLGYVTIADGGITAFNTDIVDKLLSARPFDPRQRPWYIAALTNRQTSWVTPYVDVNTGKLATTCSTPLFDERGDLVGVVGFDVLLTTIREDLLSEESGDSSFSVLINNNGELLFSPELGSDAPAWQRQLTASNLRNIADPVFQQMLNRVLADENNVEQLTIAGESLFLAYAPIPQANLHILVVQTEAEVVRPANALREQILLEQNTIRNQSLWLLLLCLITVPIAAALFSKLLASPLSDLTVGAQRVAAGDLSHQISVSSHDEIGELVQSFNQMTASLRHKVAELEANISQLATLNQISNDFRATMTFSELLKAIPREVCDALLFDRCVLYIREHDQLRAASAAFAGQPDEEVEDFLAAVNKRPILLTDNVIEADVVRSGQAVIVDDPWNNPRVGRAKQQLTRSESYVQVPIFGNKEHVIGLISVDYYAHRGVSVTPSDAARLLTFASMVGLTLENASLYNDLERQVARRTEELRIALERAQEADKLKGEFLANVSHELRTPLNAIIGFSTIMLDEMDGPISSMQREDLRTINQNGRYLLSMIDDLLDLARIDAGRLDLQREAIDLVALAHEVLDTSEGLLVGQALTLQVIAPEQVPFAYADRSKIRQVMLNLLANAIKFTDEGSVVIHIRPSVVSQRTNHSEDAVPVLRISVRDTGMGIAPDELGIIFDEFRQAHRRTKAKGGSGLGLAIVRRLVEAHGGQIWAESVPGHGSTFTFTLPTVPPTPQVRAEVALQHTRMAP